jgi:formate C-acetyltransferase
MDNVNGADSVKGGASSEYGFYTPPFLKRPVRLCEKTRKFAWESLDHKYGLDTRKTDMIPLDEVPEFESFGPLDRYDTAVRMIAENAPVRICEDELLSGAATLGGAIRHVVPASFKGEPVYWSVSHLTVSFESILTYGISGLRRKAQEALERFRGTEKERFSLSCLNTLDSFELWINRYVKALEGLPGYEDNLRNLRKVPMDPPGDFYEAVQSLWATFAFLRLCGNWPGIGRIDRLLGSYLKADLESGKLTLDRAREILAHFFIKGCEWVSGGDYGSGDAQHYQNIVIGGVDAGGNLAENEVTFLVLDIIEELGISDFPTTVRLGANASPELIRRTSEVIRLGGGTVAVYNEDKIIETLTGYGYPFSEAREFANDGCWEVQIPGTTDFGYMPFDSLSILQHTTLKNYDIDSPEELFPDFEALYGAYIADLSEFVRSFTNGCKCGYRFDEKGAFAGFAPAFPSTAIALFERGCIEKGLGYHEGGPKYQIRSPHIGGAADTVNSLYAIKKAVFDDKLLTLSEFFAVLRDNWEGSEPLRRTMLTKYDYYGTDNDEVDALMARLLGDFADICDGLNTFAASGPNGEEKGVDRPLPIEGYGYKFPAGVSTFGRQLEWAPHRLAAPHGRKRGEVLAANCSPTPGTDTLGATAIIRSYCKCRLERLVTGAALDIRLMPSCVKGEDGLAALEGLLRGFTALGGFFMQIDVADPAVLRDAQEHPEDHQTLSVRVSGWNARFVTLNREWQDMVIGQAEGGDKTFGSCPKGNCG